MANKKDNQRVKMTKKIIKNTLINMLKEININKITVSSLCKKAEINRSTFYKYYDDIYDLVKKIEDEMFDKIKENIKKCELDEGVSYVNAKNILEEIKENKELYCMLAGKYNDEKFFKKIRNMGKDTCINKWKVLNPNIDYKYLEAFYVVYSNGFFNLVIQWLDGKLDITEKELIDIETRMFNLLPNIYDMKINS